VVACLTLDSGSQVQSQLGRGGGRIFRAIKNLKYTILQTGDKAAGLML
jgi:hypothetical protein